MSGAEVAAYLRTLQRELLDEQKRLRDAQGAQPAQVAQVNQEAEAAWSHLLGVFVPSLDARTLDATATRLALPGVAARAVAERRMARQQELQGILARLAANPEFVQRESLVNEAEIRTPELEEHMAPLRADIEQLESEPLWHELVSQNYGTSDYRRKWYQSGYFRHWKFGDRIVDKHGARFGARDFARLRARYDAEKQALLSFEREHDELVARNERIRALCVENGEAQAGLAKLDEWLLGHTRALVREHLAALSLADVTPLVQSDPALLLAAKRVHGAQAKQKYLGAIGDEWLSKPLQDVQRRLEKVSRGITKFQSPKCTYGVFSPEEIEAKYGLPTEKWRQRWDRYDNTCREIMVFNNYGYVDPFSSYLWWDLMIHSHHGSFIPEVAEHHRHHHDVYTEPVHHDAVYANDAS